MDVVRVLLGGWEEEELVGQHKLTFPVVGRRRRRIHAFLK